MKINSRLYLTAICLLAGLSSCKTTQPPAPIAAAPEPVQIYEPQAVIEAPAPAPQPIIAPDYTTLPGHSSVTTPVPVEPVEVEGLGPVQ